jgi:hypothetical protein
VQERDLAKVQLDYRCKIKPDAWPNREPYEGYLERIMPIADRAKSIVSVRIKVLVPPGEEQGKFLKPNMGVTVTFVKEFVDQAFKDRLKKSQEDEAQKPAAN